MAIPTQKVSTITYVLEEVMFVWLLCLCTITFNPKMPLADHLDHVLPTIPAAGPPHAREYLTSTSPSCDHRTSSKFSRHGLFVPMVEHLRASLLADLDCANVCHLLWNYCEH